MFYLIGYGLLITILFLFAVFLFLYAFFGVISQIMGSPYVPTSQKEIDLILKTAALQNGQLFIELGSGDGRIIRSAVKTYGVKGIGVEIHPFLLWYSRIKAKKDRLKNLVFKRENFFHTPLRKADVIFLFLLPSTLKKLKSKLEKECGDKNVQVISHGFAIEGWHKLLITTMTHKPFPTYFYRLPTSYLA